MSYITTLKYIWCFFLVEIKTILCFGIIQKYVSNVNPFGANLTAKKDFKINNLCVLNTYNSNHKRIIFC